MKPHGNPAVDFSVAFILLYLLFVSSARHALFPFPVFLWTGPLVLSHWLSFFLFFCFFLFISSPPLQVLVDGKMRKGKALPRAVWFCHIG
jgi:hypothetical protein